MEPVARAGRLSALAAPEGCERGLGDLSKECCLRRNLTPAWCSRRGQVRQGRTGSVTELAMPLLRMRKSGQRHARRSVSSVLGSVEAEMSEREREKSLQILSLHA